MSDSMVGIANLNFPGHSLCTPLLTRAGICSRYCFAKMSYKRKHSSYDASFKICLIKNMYSWSKLRGSTYRQVSNFGHLFDLLEHMSTYMQIDLHVSIYGNYTLHSTDR